MNNEQVINYVNHTWQDSIIPSLIDYIRIPNKSPLFDANWQQHGYMEQAVALMKAWCEQHAVKDMQLEVLRAENRTPLIYIDIPGSTDETILLYGHYDKQPEMSGWKEGLGPWTPVLKDDKLYGRGGADDGYAIFSSLTAINALQQQNIPHARCVILIEGSEESGSRDLPFYIDQLKQRIGNPSLVVCLDSGCGNYDQLWMTTSLRGNIIGDLSVELLTEGVHSGNATGIVASSFRVMRQLLNRIENEKNGTILLDELHVDIPPLRQQQAQDAAAILQQQVYSEFPFHENVKPANDDLKQLILNRTWRPGLAITGVQGLPALDDAGNVMRPQTAIRLSMRIPPTCNPKNASQAIKENLERDPPYDAHVNYTLQQTAMGWEAPVLSDWLSAAAANASESFFGKNAAYMGEGVTIPFMGMLGEKFPEADFLITGVLGPHSNAHGPNEFLHIPTAKRVTCCVAAIIADHYRRLDI